MADAEGGYVHQHRVLPLRAAAAAAEPLVSVDTPDVVVESVKLADDRSGDVIVRVYEATGGVGAATMRTAFPLAGAADADLLEAAGSELSVGTDGASVRFAMRPFQIRTLRLRRG